MLRGCFPRSKNKVLIGSYRNVTEHELQRVMSDLLVKMERVEEDQMLIMLVKKSLWLIFFKLVVQEPKNTHV